MNIDDLSIGDVGKLISALENCGRSTSFRTGQAYLVETATKYYLGVIAEITDETIVLRDSCWIADTGRFAEFMSTGKPAEAEPVGQKTHIPCSSINAAHEWPHAMVTEVL